MKPLILAAVLFALAFVVEAYSHENEIIIEVQEVITVDPFKFRAVVIEPPMSNCQALRDEFIVAAEAYTTLGRKYRAVKAMNIASRAIAEGCWRRGNITKAKEK